MKRNYILENVQDVEKEWTLAILLDGYCDRDNSACRKKIFSDKEWKKHYNDNGEDCWTTWEELECDINYTKDGEEVENKDCKCYWCNK